MELVELSVHGTTFLARSAGPPDGRPVLLLHGFPESGAQWRGQLSGLSAAGYRALAPDQRGYSPGARPADIAAYRMNELIEDVVGFVGALGGGPVDLVGHDWGAAVAWQVAARRPELVRTLTAVSVPHPAAFAAALRDDPDQKRRSEYLRLFREPAKAASVLLADDGQRFRAMFAGSGIPAGQIDDYLAAQQAPGALVAALSWYAAMAADDYRTLGPVSVPTLYVWSDNDMALGRTAAEATAGFVTGPYRFEALAGVTHWVPEEAASALTTLLLEHLQHADAAG